ncbi:hypothetical protein HOU03_gp193 [Caulobacter phage CcrSC]|uniref:Uncharacterized protein n=1 Tax=Caulobacter phage CcrSC TaxID=2283272 RepID=A0A385EG14_9CAUD|nr:hypothetical protein HOU03_gp193 [Caulobacter phage CcrSC]AXQ70075.1 hypothetical protein CcrSC_gp493 [Caulobacter phage CcrSC]
MREGGYPPLAPMTRAEKWGLVGEAVVIVMIFAALAWVYSLGS